MPLHKNAECATSTMRLYPVIVKSENIYRERESDLTKTVVISTGQYAKTTKKYYKHVPDKVRNDDQTTSILDMPVQANKDIKLNRPEIIIKHWKQ